MDCHQKIEHEYRKKLGGTEMFEKWYKEATIDCRFQGKLSERNLTALTKLGCHESSDHVFIAVAIESPDKILLTEDSDMGKGVKGQEMTSRQILAHLTDTLKLEVFDANEALEFLGIE